MATAANSRRQTLRSDDGDNEWPAETGANQRQRRRKSKQKTEDQEPLPPAIAYMEDEFNCKNRDQPTSSNRNTVSKYKVIVNPARNCKGVQTSADTKKILMSKAPQELGIQAERVTMCRDNSVRIESRCPSILKLGDKSGERALYYKLPLIEVRLQFFVLSHSRFV
ncbi:hypothetical protein GEV33_004237 [Tenebrio molitor]|uniref:Uncharacterized protein n=1 Tax=Tenebrio molitor TaxID=7067 RepID=A0A8J6HPW4_TENMO|nr:hypothetical protein GEV33_004237 [Tenebrio molitor]